MTLSHPCMQQHQVRGGVGKCNRMLQSGLKQYSRSRDKLYWMPILDKAIMRYGEVASSCMPCEAAEGCQGCCQAHRYSAWTPSPSRAVGLRYQHGTYLDLCKRCASL